MVKTKNIVLALLAALLLAATGVKAQQTQTWDQVWQELMEGEDLDDEAREEDFERLSQLAAHPLDLNRATREELEQLPFLSAQQVEDLAEYRDRYGPMRSLGELRMVRSMDYVQLQLMPFFVFIDGTADKEQATTRRQQPYTEMTATARLPFYERSGDRQGYLGYKYRHSLRLEHTFSNGTRAGIVGAQDAGEPFFAGRNKWGYDAYSYYVQTGPVGIVDKAVIGKFKMSAGMGLVMNTSFSMGKLATLQTLGRQATTLRPHSSRSEADYFQGAAVTLALARRKERAGSPLQLTTFLSYRPMDGTLDADGTLTNLTTTGYHRTETEMGRKHNTHLTAAGGRLAFRHGGWRAAANAVHTHLDRRLCPPPTVLYRRYSPQGADFTNMSLDYGYTHHRFAVSGETAVSGNGAVATINSISCLPTASLSVMALWRLYSYRYTGLYSHSFGDSSSAQNESGLFLGASWTPLAHLHLQAYADMVHFPWARYLVSLPSDAYDLALQAKYQRRRWALLARGRVRLRQRDNEAKTALTSNNEYRGRLAVTASLSPAVSTKTQIDAVRTFYLEASHGWMVSQHVTWQQTWLTASAMAALFDTDGYASRIYLYERQMAHEFSSPSFYGEGLRLLIMAGARLGRSITLTARLGYTNYFDRATIGTAMQQIDHSHQTDLDIQLRWKM